MDKMALAIEKRTEVKPIKVDLTCGKCGGIFERNTDRVLTTYPPQYSYKCNKCGEIVTASKIFPTIEYEEIEKIEENKKRHYISDDMTFVDYLKQIYGNELPEPVKILEAFCLLYGHENPDSERGILISAITEFCKNYYVILEENSRYLKNEEIINRNKDWRLT